MRFRSPDYQAIDDGGAASWEQQLKVARSVAGEAAAAISPEFGHRYITQRRGPYDVQLRADITAQDIIVSRLLAEFPDYGLVAEEGMQDGWNQASNMWAVDPLDGTNNFGYGIAHCATSIALFAEEQVVLSVVRDVLLDREYYAIQAKPRADVRFAHTPVERATVSLVTDYSPEGRVGGNELERVLSAHCKRVVTLWAPALDLALIANGGLDAMVCLRASLLDVCSGIFLVQMAGGSVLDPGGLPLRIFRHQHAAPVAFVAARDAALAQKLLKLVDPLGG
jgi:myo-inositol-1(or 4)-monophosphatase